MLQRLKKQQGGDNWDETLPFAYDTTIGAPELTATMAVCSRPTQDQGTHHPSMEGVGACESSMLAEELLIVNGYHRVERRFSLGWAWSVDHAFLGSLILTRMYGSTNKIHRDI